MADFFKSFLEFLVDLFAALSGFLGDKFKGNLDLGGLIDDIENIGGETAGE